MRQMTTVRFHRYGGPEVLQVDTVPVPEPGPGQVLIRVEAAGVNFADTMQRRNAYGLPTQLPFGPGYEAAGPVAAVGPGVTAPAVGTPVFALLGGGGGYAQYAVAPAEQVIPVPPGVGAGEATALLVQGLTAYLGLKEAGRLRPGEAVLVQAAAGGVGSLAVQLAKLLGAGRVIGLAGTEAKRDAVRALGADAAVDYTAADWPARVKELTGGKGVDVVMEMSGGATFGQSLGCLASFGRSVVYGNAGGEPAQLDPMNLVWANQSVVGFGLGSYLGAPGVVAAALGELVGHAVAGRLKLRVGHALPLSEAAEAHRLLEGRLTTGKIVLRPWAES